MTIDQRKRSIKKFITTGVDGKRDELQSNFEEAIESRAAVEEDPQSLLITATTCGIQNVLQPILQTIFDKANKLVCSKGLVVPQPGSTNGSYIVAGHLNKIFIVTPGKGAACLVIDLALTNLQRSMSIPLL